MFQDASKTIQNFLLANVSELVQGDIVISGLHSDPNLTLTAKLVVCLYNVELKAPMQLAGREETETGFSRMPLAVTLNYLITSFSSEEESEKLLGRVVQAFHTWPRIGKEYFASGLQTRVDFLRVSKRNLTINDMNQLWTAFGRGMRLALYYDVDAVYIPVKSDGPVSPPVPPVDEVKIGLHHLSELSELEGL